MRILEECAVRDLLDAHPSTFRDQAAFDRLHASLCSRAMGAARRILPGIAAAAFSYGIAAKLINVYFKAAVWVPADGKVVPLPVLHPPIDRILLEALAQTGFGGRAGYWRRMARLGWSTFSRDDYCSVIDEARRGLPPGVPLWAIERLWRGFR